ncbi:peptidoglycan glycosyltransferase MrdB [Sphingosinicella ginsenosidimutans]|uniref:Peptidoglycan glycosyltransferase MrdB n=1 Tax=Allosphingosinicella ginsenosidimutans TaxID=1176539 RepID=A0A5C6TUY2_9SPHN|nr:rod shape-determining protein RodA [Sphingosinicella ginsenosidimutans]TXC64202.1 rod shape-determining protein RodA [Sphingosinicella ginsenosidimutans]
MALPRFPAPIASLPWRMLWIVIALCGFGLVILYSAAGGHMTWALPQGIRFAVFLGMAIAMGYLPPSFYKEWAFLAYGGLMIMLVLVEALGAISGGAQRWLDLGLVRLQPSELMKPAIVLVVARFYDMLPAREIRSWTAIWPALVLIGLPAGLILIQPDLGTATMVALGGITVMFLAGIPLRLFVGAGVAAAIIVPLAYFFGLHDYQRQRIAIFLDPETDPLGAGYHITQSKIAIGAGGLTGTGYLQGTQSHFAFLPEPQTDFVFATMAEEWGLAGGLFIIIGFALLIRWGIIVALDTKGRFERLTAAGLITTIFFYMAINLAMVMGLAPVVGIPLPLISYGGSAIMTVMICLGVMMSIDRRNRLDPRRR